MEKTRSSDSIVYPALCIARGNAVRVAHSDADLTRCRSRELWGAHLYDGMVVVDAASDVFCVKHARSRERMSLLRRFAARWRNLPLVVDLDLACEGEATLNSIRQRVAESLAGQPVPAHSEDVCEELRDTLERIRRSRSMAELISIFY
jgi:hypothetical protein